jgi:hypothetical protein
MNMIVGSDMVVLGPSVEMGMGQNADVLEEGQGAVHGGLIDVGILLLNASDDVGGRYVALGPHDGLDDRPSLGGHPVTPFSQ